MGSFLQKLRASRDGDGNLVDHSMTVYGGGNGNVHEHRNLPCLVGDGGGGGRRAARTSLTVIDKAGVPAEELGDSAGLLDTRPLTGCRCPRWGTATQRRGWI